MLSSAPAKIGGMARRPELPPEQGERVRAIIRELVAARFHGNQSEAARALSVKPAAINQVISAKNGPSYQLASRVAKLLGLQVHEILGPEVPQIRDTKTVTHAK